MPDAVCDKRTYPVNDTDWLPCGAPATSEVLDIDDEWHPRCDPHIPLFARSRDADTRVRAPARPRRSDRHNVEATVTARAVMSPRLLAEVFAEMSDEGQAQFFIEVADVARGWGADPHAQWFRVGRHLATCECSTDEARELVAVIARGAAAGPG